MPDNTDGPSMEVSRNAEDDCLVFGHTLLHICPLPCELDGRLDGLCAGVHRKYHIVPKHFCDLLGEASEDTVVECPRRECKLLCLFYQGADDLRVAVPLLLR
jgi:hypothetical protein